MAMGADCRAALASSISCRWCCRPASSFVGLPGTVSPVHLTLVHRRSIDRAADRPSDRPGVWRGSEARGRYETACRRRSTIGRVFRHAIATGRGQSHPTAANPALSWRRPSLTCQVPAGPDAARPHREAWTRIRVCAGPSSHGSTIPSRLRRLARPQKANLVITILCWYVSESPISKIQQIQPSDRRFDSVLDPIASAAVSKGEPAFDLQTRPRMHQARPLQRGAPPTTGHRTRSVARSNWRRRQPSRSAAGQ